MPSVGGWLLCWMGTVATLVRQCSSARFAGSSALQQLLPHVAELLRSRGSALTKKIVPNLLVAGGMILLCLV